MGEECSLRSDRFSVWWQPFDKSSPETYVDVIIEMNAVVQFREWAHELKQEIFFTDLKNSGSTDPTADLNTDDARGETQMSVDTED